MFRDCCTACRCGSQEPTHPERLPRHHRSARRRLTRRFARALLRGSYRTGVTSARLHVPAASRRRRGRFLRGCVPPLARASGAEPGFPLVPPARRVPTHSGQAPHSKQGRLEQGHRVVLLRKFLGGFFQSLTRWLLNARETDRELHHNPERHPAGSRQLCPWLPGAGRTGSSPGSCASSSSCWSPCPSSMAEEDSDGPLVGSSDDVGAGACGVTADLPAGSSAVGAVSASSIPSVVLGRGCDVGVADGLAPALGCRLSRDPTGLRRGDVGSTVPSGCRVDGCVAGETEPTGRSAVSVSDAAPAVEATTPTDTETTIRRRTNPLRRRRTRMGTPR
jgi:hypothetical protein